MASYTKTQRKSAQDQTQEEGIQLLQRMISQEHMLQEDIWAAPVEVLDLHLPQSSLSAKSKPSAVKDAAALAWANARNSFLNAQSMHALAKDGMFPSIHIQRPLSLPIFGTRSTKDDAWIAPWRAEFLDTYKKVNTAVASGDKKALKALTTDAYQASAQARLRAYHPHTPGPYPTTYKWKLHQLNAPVRVESIRAIQGHYGLQEPKTGSRLLVHALVRFESTQTLHVYGRNGALIKDQGQPVPKPVKEFLVFEKRMWYDGPWMIKDQFYEDA
ncbi:hypothetical protein EWM64_g3093 [Hericium alpestre]|uniref:Tim44-like domain-containing protein n=1 Tax=Hericium alpestre TaxID=135208 RepID=A0A4Z0A3A0_9AGAM|nr:hypothetical protein EWM64_g3093 [Hericium alpestre]